MPLYRQIESDIRTRVEDGSMAPGTRLPSEAELADLYSASRITVRQALKNLASEGLVSRHPGRGTFVRDSPVKSEERRITSLATEMRELGFDIETEVLRQEIVDNPSEMVFADSTWEGPVLRLVRVRIADGTPIAYQESELPAERFPGIEDLDFTSSMYDRLLDRYGVVPLEAEETVSVESLEDQSDEVISRMGSSVSSCVMVLERVAYDHEGLIEHGRSIVDASRYKLRLGLRRRPGH